MTIDTNTLAIAARLDRETGGAIGTKAALARAKAAAGLEVGAARIWSALVQIRQARSARIARRASRTPTGRRAITLPQGTPAARLDALRLAAAEQHIVRALRRGVNDTVALALTDDPAQVGVAQAETVSYPYRGRFKNWACRARAWAVTVPRMYRARVAARDLVCPGDLPTLDASPLDCAHAGVELFAAAWVVQGRGFAASVARGYIARDIASRATYHADSVARALAGLRRKTAAAAWSAASRTADVAALAQGHETRRVTLADARAVGACEYGVRAWAARVGLDYSRGEATLGEVVAGYATHPAPEARAVILRALRRARQAVRP